MTATITNLYGNTNHSLDVSTDEVLDNLKGQARTVFICGDHMDGTFFIDASVSDKGAFLMALHKAIRLLVDLEMGTEVLDPLYPEEED